jgi:diguanylate cyclase (GGDEF)-like protein
MFSTQIEVTGKNIKQYHGVRELAYLDDVTGLYNTRYLGQILDREVRQAAATKQSFAVLFIDADYFKQINDKHGHLVGSKILQELGAHLKNFVRGSDTLFRYGGDEFVGVFSPCDLATSKLVADRIRKSVEEKPFLVNEGLNIHFTVSIGVALFPDHASTQKEILEVADRVMYTAKRQRNSVYIAK